MQEKKENKEKNVLDIVWQNRKQILEGIKNKIFRSEHVEEIAKGRMDICLACSDIDHDGGECLIPGTQPCCKECGCSLELKTRSLSSKCDSDKWDALINEDDEEIIEKLNS